jgi:ceramide glucosyltransferase
MILSSTVAAVPLGVAIFAHLASIAAVIKRCRKKSDVMPVPPQAPAISLIRPVCGTENYIEETLRSTFDLNYPDYEILFCVASPRDPVIPIVERLIAAHPGRPTVLLVGGEQISANPKLNNCVKGWQAARHDLIIMADSNVLMPSDYIQRLLDKLDDQTGLVCSPPIGACPSGFWAEVECAFLNVFQARWQLVADSVGLGFAQGKTMLWRRDILERAGGIGMLAAEVAEDAASTKVVRETGLQVRLVDAPFPQPLGRRSLREIWHRQVRWARLRRASFPLFFALECVAGILPPLTALAVICAENDLPLAGLMGAFTLFWYGAEILLAMAAGWPLPTLALVQSVLRDIMHPLIWVAGWWGTDFVWRGNAMSVAPTTRMS